MAFVREEVIGRMVKSSKAQTRPARQVLKSVARDTRDDAAVPVRPPGAEASYWLLAVRPTKSDPAGSAQTWDAQVRGSYQLDSRGGAHVHAATANQSACAKAGDSRESRLQSHARVRWIQNESLQRRLVAEGEPSKRMQDRNSKVCLHRVLQGALCSFATPQHSS